MNQKQNKIRKTLFHYLNSSIYFTIDILSPYKTDKGEKAYFLDESFTAYELESELMKAIKGKHPNIEAITVDEF
ncbi:MAG: hypothetical protein ACR2IJ_07755 [Fluviibacter sp.]